MPFVPLRDTFFINETNVYCSKSTQSTQKKIVSVPTAMQAIISYTLHQSGNEKVQSVNALVGETNDGIQNENAVCICNCL